MKFAIIFLLLFASVNIFAQQAPGVIKQPPVFDQVPAPVPPPPPPPPAQAGNTELIQLLRAQTDAIKSLSSRLDAVEQRLVKIEQRNHP